MADLIERQTTIDAVQGIGRIATLPDNDAVIRMSAVEHVLFNLPSAQSERKTGKWIRETKHYKDDEQEYYYYEEHCSSCGVKRKIGWRYANFCPNCGALMRGEENGTG